MTVVRFEFVASGADSVNAAFASITSAANKTQRAAETTGRTLEQSNAKAARAAGPYRSPAAAEGAAAVRSAREQERALNYVARVRDRHFLQQQRQQEKVEAGNKRQHEQAIAREQRFADVSRQRTITAVRGHVGSAVLGGIGLGAAALGGIVGAGARDSLKLQDTANRVSINARGAGQQAVDPTTLRREFENTAIKTPGISAQDVGEAAQAYVDLTGDLKTARDNMGSFATVASATGARIQDVATAAASLGKNFDVKSAKDMQQVMATLGFQGKGGAVTMKDLAAQFQKLAAAGSAFDIGKGPQAVATLGGLMQIARTGTRSPTQAGTAVENVFSALTTKTGLLHKEGVNVYDKAGHKRNIEDVLVDTISKSGGHDFEKKNSVLANVFGKQGMRAINPLIAAYQDTYQNTKGSDADKTAAGVAALRDAFAKATNVAANWAEVQADAAQAQEDSSAKLTASWEAIKAKVGDAMIPPLSKLADSLTGTESALDPFIQAIGLAAEALAGLAAWMKANGFGPAEKTHSEKAAEAQGKLDRINGKLDAKGLSEFSATDADLKKAGTSRAELRALQGTVKAENAASWMSSKDDLKRLTADDFAKQYAALNPHEGGDLEASDMASKLSRNPAAAGASNDFLQGINGENDKQKDLRHRFQAQVASGDNGQGITPEVQAAMDALGAMAKAAAAELAKVKAPDASAGHIAVGAQ